MIVKEMARRLSQATGQTEELHAGQIRNYVRNGLFGFEHPERSGEEANSRFYFNDRHLAAARIYSFFLASGVHVSRLEGLARGFKHLDASYPWIEEDGHQRKPNGIETVVNEAKRGNLNWYLVYGGDLAGNLVGFHFTENPWPNQQLLRAFESDGDELTEADKGLIRMAHERKALRYPLHGVLFLAPLFSRLFAPDTGSEA
ncbi:hypothetical protein [Stappia indica]|uniref:Uncharacterized protein n=1 Tax=Stappia indica TaxID=538381 RepID=A0A857CDQ6_9HYPH|nr:hypothetical protein [Stappia indica]QGZ36582.1 hypothetical protein GH266_20080 [Stappia indica]